MGEFWDKIENLVSGGERRKELIRSLYATTSTKEVELIWSSMTPDEQNDEFLIQVRNSRLSASEAIETSKDPLTELMTGALDEWLLTIKKYETNDPEKAKGNLVLLTKDVMILAAAAAAIDYALGAIPGVQEGTVSAANTKQLLSWLGVGAVITAVAHDPVKIGLLRPYQDSLEQTFRNRRPNDMALFQAYKTRELSPVKVDDLSLLTDAEMDRIEIDNDKVYFSEIAKWGYSEWFANALARSATNTLNFSQLSALAKQGLLTKGMAIYSLWGQGLDRVVMKPALDALMQQNRISNYEGFRAQIEPSYIEGILTEVELVDYWSKINIPRDVQEAMLPRFRKKREAYIAKQSTIAAGIQRDLTVSQIQQAHQNKLLERAQAQNSLISLGYSLDEARILLDLAEMRRKLPGSATLKRLPLTDYEKAHKNGLISADEVINRMRGEYFESDIELEKALLKAGKA